MTAIKAKESQKILETLKNNIESFYEVEKVIEQDSLIEQNVLRSIILFSCAGIDAIVKQLIIETLDKVIERDEGAQEQLKKYTERKLKNNTDFNYSLLAELFTARNSRKYLIDMLKNELSYGSLQSPEELYRAAGHFNISTDSLIANEKRTVLKRAFQTRNVIIHQMDVELHNNCEIIKHSHDEVKEFYDVIIEVAQNFIDQVNEILKRDITPNYAPIIRLKNESFIIQE